MYTQQTVKLKIKNDEIIESPEVQFLTFRILDTIRIYLEYLGYYSKL